MSKALTAHLHWLVGAITADQAPRKLDRLGGAAVAPAVGLGIYRHAYRARLVECLADDYPVLQALPGVEPFAALAHAVIAAHPSQEPTLNRYGRWLLRYLRAHPKATAHGRLAYDLARLEWALVEAVHAPLAPAFAVASLAASKPRLLARARLVAVPSLRLIASRWSIDSCYRQFLRREPVVVPPCEAETVAVTRRSAGLHRLAVRAGEARLLTLLVRGRPLGQALTISGLTPAAVQVALARCIEAGCFMSLTDTKTT
ncbi:MAG: DNA-binding domain-containing protein [Planctomycetota bacterium]